MVLKDIAERAHIDVSTVSRANQLQICGKQTTVLILDAISFPTQFTSADGETVAARKVKAAIQEIIAAEDKRKPLSDEAVATLLAERGLKVARRTVSKYREQLGIAKAGLRR